MVLHFTMLLLPKDSPYLHALQWSIPFLYRKYLLPFIQHECTNPHLQRTIN
jgi:hypothetical protein